MTPMGATIDTTRVLTMVRPMPVTVNTVCHPSSVRRSRAAQDGGMGRGIKDVHSSVRVGSTRDRNRYRRMTPSNSRRIAGRRTICLGWYPLPVMISKRCTRLMIS